MKIVKDTGEPSTPPLHRRIAAELRPVLAVTGAGTALLTGSVILVRRGWTLLGEHLDTWERLGALGLTGYAIVYTGQQHSHIATFAAPGAAVAWCVAAWWIAPPAVAEADEDPPADSPADDPADRFTAWLLDLIGDQPGIHLRDLYPAMRTLPGHEARDDAHLRAALKALNIPVRRSLRIGAVAGRSGVARADLPPLPSPHGEWSGDDDGDAGQTADSPTGEPLGERLESA